MTANDASDVDRLSAVTAYAVIGAASDDPVIADLSELCEVAATLFGAPAAVVNMLDDRFQHQVAAYGVDPTPCELDQAMCYTTLAGGHDVCVSNALDDERYAGSPWVDGTLANVRLYCSAILRNPEGHAVGTLCVFDEQVHEIDEAQVRGLHLLGRQVVDVLELRLRSRQLSVSNAELLRSQDRLATFAGQISHDLKAPITAILGFTELLGDLDTVADDPSAVSYVGRCTSAGRRMLAMIDDLLAFARIGGTLDPRPMALDTLLPQVLDDLGAMTADAQISWSGPDVVADAVQLRAVVQNLVGNALKYRGDGPCVVRVVSDRAGAAVLLRVIDNGPGIPLESREEVLRPLFRIRKDVPGAGLGLAVCVRVLAAHGGALRLDDTPGGGLTVTAEFPV